MRRVIRHHHHGEWPQDKASSALSLSWEDRHRRRIVLKDDKGHDFLLDLPKAIQMSEGDGLETDDGDWIMIHALEEDVAEVSGHSAQEIARIAWHIGNRHQPLQFLDDGRLRLPWDHVLVAMIEGLGAHVTRTKASFHPEKGAYDQGHSSHSHSHSHQDDKGEVIHHDH